MANYPKLHMIIDGEHVSAGDRSTHRVVNPANEETVGELPLATPADLDRALDAAGKGFKLWRDSSPARRAAVLSGAARLLNERLEENATWCTLEEGKTLGEAKMELQYSAALFEYYANECQRVYGRTLTRPAGQRTTVMHEPVGPVAAFAAWNFPFSNCARKLGAPIAAGCSVILKAAEETPASALALVQALLDAGLPGSVAQAVFGVPDEVSRHLIGSPIIRKISFTGSTMVGKHLIKLAADDLKRTTMELGGHAPVLVFDDADLEATLKTTVPQKARNAGQVCTSPTRFLVEDRVFDSFVSGFAERFGALKVGNGMDASTQMGPLANPRRPDAVARLVSDAVGKGAKLVTGGERVGNQGYFFAPTVLADVPSDAAIMNEEPFGPVAIINRSEGEAAMIAEANRLPYGLAAYAWTTSAKRQRTLAREIETGMLGINTAAIVNVDSPFGGVKWSGHGSEDGPEGLAAYMVTKAVHEG